MNEDKELAGRLVPTMCVEVYTDVVGKRWEELELVNRVVERNLGGLVVDIDPEKAMTGGSLFEKVTPGGNFGSVGTELELPGGKALELLVEMATGHGRQWEDTAPLLNPKVTARIVFRMAH